MEHSAEMSEFSDEGKAKGDDDDFKYEVLTPEVSSTGTGGCDVVFDVVV
jgi:hypothetical protein